jgi:hypothetical protein
MKEKKEKKEKKIPPTIDSINNSQKTIDIVFNGKSVWRYEMDGIIQGLIFDNVKKRDLLIIKHIVKNLKNKGEKISNPSYSKKELKKGTSVEMEHTNDPEVAEQIAKDHLEEFPEYYEELEKMEKRLQKQNPVHSRQSFEASQRKVEPKSLISGSEWRDKIEKMRKNKPIEEEDEDLGGSYKMDKPETAQFLANPTSDDGKTIYHVEWFQGLVEDSLDPMAVRRVKANSPKQALHFVIYGELKDLGCIYFNQQKFTCDDFSDSEKCVSDILEIAIAMENQKNKKGQHLLTIDEDIPKKKSNPKKKKEEKELCSHCDKEKGLDDIYDIDGSFYCNSCINKLESEFEARKAQEEIEDEGKEIVLKEHKTKKVKKAKNKSNKGK